MKNSNNPTGNQTCNLPACKAIAYPPYVYNLNAILYPFFGVIPVAWIVCADVSERSFCFTFIYRVYYFFWGDSRRLNCMCRRFGTLCMFNLHRPTPPLKMEHKGVPKRWHVKFRPREIAQKKEYDICNTQNFEIKKNEDICCFFILETLLSTVKILQ
jgi:hypothetical protein